MRPGFVLWGCEIRFQWGNLWECNFLWILLKARFGCSFEFLDTFMYVPSVQLIFRAWIKYFKFQLLWIIKINLRTDLPLLRGNIKFNFMLFNMFNNSGEEGSESVKEKILKLCNAEEIYRFPLQSHFMPYLIWSKSLPSIFLPMKGSPFLEKLKLTTLWIFFIFIIKLFICQREVVKPKCKLY